jgi:hypothetical protein
MTSTGSGGSVDPVVFLLIRLNQHHQHVEASHLDDETLVTIPSLSQTIDANNGVNDSRPIRRKTMPTKFTGGCLCGRVRDECSGDPFFMGNRHCRDCQKAGGGAYEPDIGLPASALKITGMVKYYDKKADSGNTLSRGFCPECGSSLFGKTSANAGSCDDHGGQPRRPEPVQAHFGHLHIQRPALGPHESDAGQISKNAAGGWIGRATPHATVNRCLNLPSI